MVAGLRVGVLITNTPFHPPFLPTFVPFGASVRLDVALKRLNESDNAYIIQMTKREIRLLQMVHHPHILQFLGLVEVAPGRDHHGLYLVSPFYPFGDMHRVRQMRVWLYRVGLDDPPFHLYSHPVCPLLIFSVDIESGLWAFLEASVAMGL